MSTKSFSFSMDKLAYQAWKQTVPRDKNLHDAIPEDLAKIALQRDEGQLTDRQRDACRAILNGKAPGGEQR